MAKIVIGVHGRSNKPAEELLRKWWQKAIEEGLSYSAGTGLGVVDFDMAYYADIFHSKGAIPKKDIEEPYRKAKKGDIEYYKYRFVDRLRSLAGNWLDNPIDWLEDRSHIFSAFAREICKVFLKDLGRYYSNEDTNVRIKQKLEELLIDYQDHEIILVAHSMGTIVAYDVLRELGRSKDHHGFKVEHFITMGGPLGITAVQGNIVDYHGKLRTPTCVTGSWFNFSDPQDYVCLDSHLADDYLANSSGVAVEDVLVCNDYPDNEHKSYGYLRTPEFSTHLASLL